MCILELAHGENMLLTAAPYPVRPARPRSYLDFEKRRRRRQRRRAAIIGALPGLGALAAPVAPLVSSKLSYPAYVEFFGSESK